MTSQVSSKKGFYGWIALLGAMLVYFSGCGTLFYSYGVFVPEMVDDLNWSMGAAQGVTAVFLLVHGIPGPLIGWSIARFGSRKNIIAGNLLAAAGLAGMSVVTELWQAYLFYGVMVGIGEGLGLFVACTTVANNWFERRKGLALALVLSSGGLGGLALVPLIGRLIESMGWQSTWLIIAVIHLVVAVAIGGILIRNKPEDLGQLPDGRTDDAQGSDELHTQPALRVYQTPMDWETGWAMRKLATWLIVIFGAANFFAVIALIGNLVAYLDWELGLPEAMAADVLALVPGMSIMGRLAFGALSSRFEARHLAAICLIGQIVAILGLITVEAGDTFLVRLYPMLFGVSYGGLVVALPTIIGRYYGRAHYPEILGRLLPLTTIAGAIGPVFAGAVYDATDTYVPAFVAIAILSAIGLVCALLARPPKLPEEAQHSHSSYYGGH